MCIILETCNNWETYIDLQIRIWDILYWFLTTMSVFLHYYAWSFEAEKPLSMARGPSPSSLSPSAPTKPG